jgi:beta-glucanase (GH16 family)
MGLFDAWTQTFQSDFTGSSLVLGSGSQWAPIYPGGERTNAGNSELEIYVDPTYVNSLGDTPGLNPFSVSGGILSITATEVDPTNFDGFSYASGLLQTKETFSQTYGAFEVVAQMCLGQGFWPAFWLLPVTSNPPAEIDVVECIGSRPTFAKFTLHDASLSGTQTGYPYIGSVDLTAGFHSYSVKWASDFITWYLDNVQVFQLPTPADLSAPMYLLLNMAVGGSMPGSPDETTVFPASYRVASVKAWALPSGGGGGGGGGGSGGGFGLGPGGGGGLMLDGLGVWPARQIDQAPFSGLPLATLQAALASAQLALLSLAMGQQAVSVRDANGDFVSFRPTDTNKLQSLVLQLKSSIYYQQYGQQRRSPQGPYRFTF